MLPLWQPRRACIYCGALIYPNGNAARWARIKGDARPKLLACPAHRDLVALDPLLQP